MTSLCDTSSQLHLVHDFDLHLVLALVECPARRLPVQASDPSIFGTGWVRISCMLCHLASHILWALPQERPFAQVLSNRQVPSVWECVEVDRKVRHIEEIYMGRPATGVLLCVRGEGGEGGWENITEVPTGLICHTTAINKVSSPVPLLVTLN